MKTARLFAVIVASLACMKAHHLAAKPPMYRVTNIAEESGYPSFSSINDQGDAIAANVDGAIVRLANGQVRVLQRLFPGYRCNPTDINNSRVIIGFCLNERQKDSLVTWNAEGQIEEISELDPPQPYGSLSYSAAAMVNNKGAVALAFGGEDSDEEEIDWLNLALINARGEVSRSPEQLDWTAFRYPTGISDAGVVSGTDRSRATIWGIAGKMQHLPVGPDATYSSASAIAPDGHLVVGYASFSDRPQRPMVWRLKNGTGLELDGIDERVYFSALNNAEQATGVQLSIDSTPVYRAIYWSSKDGFAFVQDLIDPEDPYASLPIVNCADINGSAQLLCSTTSDNPFGYFGLILTPVLQSP